MVVNTALSTDCPGDTGTAGRCLAQFCRAADSLTDLDPMGVSSSVLHCRAVCCSVLCRWGAMRC